jgi:hypothetical protein
MDALICASEDLKVLSKFGETADDEKFLIGRSRVDFFVFENPGIAVRHEDGVQTRG